MAYSTDGQFLYSIGEGKSIKKWDTAKMAEKLTELLVDVGKTQREHVWIRFVDSPKSEWAMGGEIQG